MGEDKIEEEKDGRTQIRNEDTGRAEPVDSAHLSESESSDEQESSESVSQVEPVKKSGALNIKKVAGVLGFTLFISLLAASVYYLRDLADNIDTLNRKLDQYALRIDGSIISGREEILGNVEIIKKSLSTSGVESSESLKRVLIFLGDLRFKIKELENKITKVSGKSLIHDSASLPGESTEEEEDSGDDDEEEAAIGQRPEDEVQISSDDASSGDDPVEKLISESGGDIKELDEEFIGEVLDRMLAKRLAEYDLSKKEEELKKKRGDRLKERNKNEKILIAIENSVVRVAEIGKLALLYCKETVFSAYEFFTR